MGLIPENNVLLSMSDGYLSSMREYVSTNPKSELGKLGALAEDSFKAADYGVYINTVPALNMLKPYVGFGLQSQGINDLNTQDINELLDLLGTTIIGTQYTFKKKDGLYCTDAFMGSVNSRSETAI